MGGFSRREPLELSGTSHQGIGNASFLIVAQLKGCMRSIINPKRKATGATLTPIPANADY
jgi:hypothetical protein